MASTQATTNHHGNFTILFKTYRKISQCLRYPLEWVSSLYKNRCVHRRVLQLSGQPPQNHVSTVTHAASLYGSSTGRAEPTGGSASTPLLHRRDVTVDCCQWTGPAAGAARFFKLPRPVLIPFTTASHPQPRKKLACLMVHVQPPTAPRAEPWHRVIGT